MADSDSILQLGIEAARAGDKAEARELFRLVTREDSNNAQGWLWLAGVAEDREEKRAALERVVEIDPSNDLARKGLAALSGARAGAADQAPRTSAPAAEAPPAAPLPVDTAPTPHRGGARRYETPKPAAAPAGAAAAIEGSGVTPAPTADDYDLEDYRQTPQPVASDLDEPGTTVVVEDEEPRRGGLAWLPVLIAVILILLAGFFLFRQFRNRSQNTAGGIGTAATTTSGAGLGALGAETATGTQIAGGPAATVSAAVVASAVPLTEVAGGAGQTTAAPVGGAQTTAQPAPNQTAAPASAQTAQPAPNQTAAPAGVETAPAPPPNQTAAPAGDQTTVVVVAPNATVVPPQPATAQPAPPPPAATTPPVPAAPVDVAAANPAAVAPGTVVQAGPWGFTFTGQKNIATGAYGGGAPTRGQYQIALLQVANNSGQPAQIPDGFFVLKDAQGRVYDFNRAASVDYLNRFGGPGVAADVGADATFPSNNALTSVPLLFDVPPDAKNLVLFSRNNPNQGFLIR